MFFTFSVTIRHVLHAGDVIKYMAKDRQYMPNFKSELKGSLQDWAYSITTFMYLVRGHVYSQTTIAQTIRRATKDYL